MAEYKIKYYLVSEYGSDSVKKYTEKTYPSKFGFYYHKKLPGCRFIGIYSLICKELLPTGYYLMLARLQQVTNTVHIS